MLAVEVSLHVFRGLKPIGNLLKRLQNLEKWMWHEKMHRLRTAEVLTVPNSRGGAQDKKNDTFSMKNHP